MPKALKEHLLSLTKAMQYINQPKLLWIPRTLLQLQLLGTIQYIQPFKVDDSEEKGSKVEDEQKKKGPW